MCWVSKVFQDAEDTFPASAGVDGGGVGPIVSKDFFSAMPHSDAEAEDSFTTHL